ncbi:MAG: hypothetical protein MI740_12605 [Halanaerobiales bacterium]|nr:hypothetical protein [Halanaerobiales bacterium]
MLKKRGVVIALTYVGAVIGAGFSSGQEIWRFFGRHQSYGLLALLITGLFLVGLAPLLFRLSKVLVIDNYHQYFYRFLPRPLAVFFDLIYSFFLIGSVSVMLAGSGEVFKDLLGLDYWLGVILTLSLLLFALYLKLEGLITVNSCIVPVLLLITIVTVGKYIQGIDPARFSALFEFKGASSGWLLDAILYGSYNLIISIAVMTEVVANEEKGDIWQGGILGGVLLLILALLLYLGLISAFAHSPQQEIPVLSLARQGGRVVYLAYIVALYFAMLSTALANFYAFNRRMVTLFKIKYELILVLTPLLLLPLVRSGFSGLVDRLYPSFGYLGIIFLIYFLILAWRVVR